MYLMNTHENPGQTTTHATSAKESWTGEYAARCSCGWNSEAEFATYSTAPLALGAGDRHVARVMDKAAAAN